MSFFLAFTWELVLLCLTKQQFTLKIAQNNKGEHFCEGAYVLFRFLAKELAGC
jgi:hypothetical protein